ncbi:hypothetical protein ACTHQY_15985 [Rhodococcoides corynebacterioides]|uniref:hypothetical protein n=1 Tax=Rhodococcoides corynebacterioides TaxID=53972 RepID=UPI003F7E61F1
MELLTAAIVAILSGGIAGGLVKWGQDRWTSKRDRRREILTEARQGANELVRSTEPVELPISYEGMEPAVPSPERMLRAATSLPSEEWYIDIRLDLSGDDRAYLDAGPHNQSGTTGDYLLDAAKRVRLECARLERAWNLR